MTEGQWIFLGNLIVAVGLFVAGLIFALVGWALARLVHGNDKRLDSVESWQEDREEKFTLMWDAMARRGDVMHPRNRPSPPRLKEGT